MSRVTGSANGGISDRERAVDRMSVDRISVAGTVGWVEGVPGGAKRHLPLIVHTATVCWPHNDSVSR